MAYLFSLNFDFQTSRTFPESIDNFYWEAAQHLVVALKSFGWTTVGSSSVSGGVSITPDGVDRWTGVSKDAAMGDFFANNRIWHVLQSPAGIQVCFEVNGGQGLARFHFHHSLNGFSSGGLWRSGSVALSTRPSDTASGPAGGREINAADLNLLPDGSGGICRMNIMAREDGNGFITTFRKPANLDNMTGALYALTFLTQANEDGGDINPYLVLRSENFNYSSFVSQTPSSLPSAPVGRVGADQVRFSVLIHGGVTTTDFNQNLNGPDPFSGAESMLPLAVWTDAAPKYVRAAVADLYVTRFNPPAIFTTVNDRQRIVFGNLSLPWDGLTVAGADVTGFVFPLVAVVTAAPGGGIPRSFNLGLEKA